MKEQNKTPEKEPNKMEARKLPDTEFKTMVIRMLKELSENFNSIKKDIDIIGKNQPEMKATQTKLKNKLQENKVK